MAQVVQAHILDTSLLADPVPKREMGSMRALGIAHGRKHERALPTGLTLDDATSSGVEIHLPRAGLGIAKGDGVSVHLVPAQGENLAPATPSQQQQPDNVGLACALGVGTGVLVESPVQAPEFVAGEKAGERGAPVHGHVARGIDADVTAGDGEFENLAQHA